MAADEPEVAPGWLPPRSPGTGPEPGPAPEPAPRRVEPTPARYERPLVPGPDDKRGPTDPLAVSSLVCGILGLALLALSLGLGFLLSLPLSIVAWRAGAIAPRRIAEGRYQSGLGLAQAGFWLGLAGIAIGVIAMIVWSILVANGLSLEEFQRDLERELDRRRANAR